MSTPHYMETYEGVVRKLLSAPNKPAVYTFYNVCYDNGSSAELMHSRIARHYNIPAFSMQSTIYPLLLSGEIENREITPDDLHPNDIGHDMVASVITYGLDKIRKCEVCCKAENSKAEGAQASSGDDTSASICNDASGSCNKLPAPLTANAYEDSVRYRNKNADIISNEGWTADTEPQNHITDIFKNGWTATKKGAKIAFKVSGSCIGVQYRRTIKLPAPVAVAKVDGKVAATLDGNFDETWGDKLCLDTLLDHGKGGEHIVEIEIVDAPEKSELPFYLVSVIASGNPKPLFLKPAFAHTIWGGTRLREDYGYDEPGDDIGECWGISAHKNGEGIVACGAYEGVKLSELWNTHPELFGNKAADGSRVLPYDRFPLLTKIIDAKADLSIQVHPDDEYAKVNENGSFGKTECWYVLDCPENGTLVVGHNAKDKAELSDMIKNGKWDKFIREIPVKKGDFIQIDPGTVHAIKGGILLLETQQNSDITYRVYDYDRLQNGKPRELHIDKSIDVITVPAKSASDSIKSFANTEANAVTEMYSCKYYTVSKVSVDGEFNFAIDVPFLCVSVLSGEGQLNGYKVNKGNHLILPAGTAKVELKGKMELIISNV
ncbi:MAG: mannose-6-phosphate isomerase, class I [Lachnospiraceae bacterium]|nr:mannose-6-phosphate isomerase, class I [Lachnospiraceae bacterium]